MWLLFYRMAVPPEHPPGTRRVRAGPFGHTGARRRASARSNNPAVS